MGIKGLDQLSKNVKQLEAFTKELDGSLGEVNFNPFDAESIEQAIVDMENLIDQKTQSYSSNLMIQGLVTNIKESFRQQIIDKATEARLDATKEDEDAE